MKPAGKILLVSDVNLEPFARLLTNDEVEPQRSQKTEPRLEARVADFGRLHPTLLSGANPDGCELALIWSHPENAVPEFRKVLEFLPADHERILAETREFAGAIARYASGFKAVFALPWIVPAASRALGLLNFRKDEGLSYLLARMNLELADRLSGHANVHVLDSPAWFARIGEKAHSPKLWYLSKTPYSSDLFREAAAEVRAAVRALEGGARKLVVVDLDDTLWGGVVGDIGWQALRLGGHDYLGEAYVDFQLALKNLKNRGILLAVVSKNEEAVALEAMRMHPEMVLRPEDFAAWRINWQDKARNIADLAADLNLGLQSVVFIDENPVERSRVREALPEVFVPEWPQEATRFKSALSALDCFDSATLTDEDRKRHELYAKEKNRETLRAEIGSMDEWIKNLGMTVTVERLSSANLQRAAQLLNKTNQMNLSTRRMTDAELMKWADHPNRAFWTFRVCDKFGDSGLTGLLSLEWDTAGNEARNEAEIRDYVLSCRVMGRRVEESLLYVAVRFASGLRARGGKLGRIVARHVPTAKNKPCLEFFKASGFQGDAAGTAFSWDLERPYPKPDGLTIAVSE
ncbi:MAG: HAD-IIIC family phosphatase [Deltaproteobacteria bacterium]|nr:HAD-IIIC family phosphatase [Deltaproteobacteria bacterium]